MLSKGLRLIIAFFIPVLIIVIIVISIFLPNNYLSKEEMKREVDAWYNKLSESCLMEGHIKGSSEYHDCISDGVTKD